MNSTIENLVIGGGPAGAMVAVRLAEAGRLVLLLEKERGPHHKVCGEFLSREGVRYLESAGIDLRALGAVPIERVRVSVGSRTAATRVPFRALSLSRRTLDEALLARAEQCGCEVRRGVEVDGLARSGDMWCVAVRGGETLRARTVFLATGKHEMRGWTRSAGAQTDLVGFKMHWRLRTEQVAALRGSMELFLFSGGYGGMSLVEGDAATLCFVIRRGRLQQFGGWHGALEEIQRVNHCVRERLAGAETLFQRPLAISPIPYGYVATEDRGVWCVGDQAAVIPSFTGDGMSIALHSAVIAAEMHLSGRSVAEFNRRLGVELRTSMQLAMLLSRAMVTASGRRLAPLALAIAPQGLRWVAAATRIPEKFMLPDNPRHAALTT